MGLMGLPVRSFVCVYIIHVQTRNWKTKRHGKSKVGANVFLSGSNGCVDFQL